MEIYKNLILDEERALYGLNNASISHCLFDGIADGESALKECTDIAVTDCDFRLRYPLWHVTDGKIISCRMAETCRAAMWYDKNILLRDCRMDGIKALRECSGVTIEGGSADSAEFGWKNTGVVIRSFTLENSKYPFFCCSDMDIAGLKMKGKYSFQYVKNAVIRNSVLDTKDAFWHTENVTVYDSEIKGEYLAWYSKNLRLIRCHISGTQPLCYCEDLILEDCTMDGCDLSFENSSVKATVSGKIDSVKNPVSGFIRADHIGEIILDEHLRSGACCEITENA